MARTDLDFHFTVHPLTGDLSMKKDRSAIEQSVKNLILSQFYERGFNIEVGSNVTDSLFENFTPLTKQTIKNNIIQVLNNFEPDVEIVDILVSMEQSNEMTVELYYNIFNNPEIRSVVIPLQRLR